MTTTGRDNVLYACGEYFPGTRTLGPPIVISIPPRIIPTHEEVPTLPPLPRRDEEPPRIPPLIPDPTNPFFVPPVIPDPTNPFFVPFVPPDPIGNGIPPNQEEPPRRRRDDDPTLIVGGGVTRRLEDLDPPGGGGGEFFDENTPTRGLVTFQQITSISNQFDVNDETTSINNPTISTEDEGTNNFPGPLYTQTIDLGDGSQESMFSNNFTGNNLYDPVYNILDYSNTEIEYVTNNLFRDIFSSSVAKEVSYFLNKSTSEPSWVEENITGLTIAKVMLSLNSILLEAFDTILDINGLPVTRFYFLTKVFNHLIRGTLNEFDTNFYLELADSISSRVRLEVIQTTNEQAKKNYILSILANSSHPTDPLRYGNEKDIIEVSRMRFLLSDIESTFDIETIDGTEYQLELHDAGAFVEYAPSLGIQENIEVSSDYVPPGEGDGYYYKIETDLGELLPLILDTQLSSAYYVDNNVRKLALDLLNQDSSYRLTANVDLINSEFSSGFSEVYSVSASYYKLDLASIESEATTDNFLERITAKYKKLTDADEIADHCKTFGSKVSQFNVQYDDLFLQYADRSGEMTLSMTDITFRQFSPKRSPTNQAILTRNLPDGFILYPVKETKDNPTGAYSRVSNFGDVVSRTLKGEMNFTVEEGLSSKRALQATNIWLNEGSYSYGLIGSANSENVYYLYNASAFPNTFEVSGRSEVGNLIYNVIKQQIESKYSFDYLTWWDVYRRLPFKDVSRLLFNFPSQVSFNLYEGWLGYRIKDVLYRYGVAPNNLVEINSTINDPIYLQEGNRNE